MYVVKQHLNWCPHSPSVQQTSLFIYISLMFTCVFLIRWYRSRMKEVRDFKYCNRNFFREFYSFVSG